MSNHLDPTPIDLALIQQAGFILTTREAFLNEPVEIKAFEGSPNQTTAQVTQMHANILDGLRTRVQQHEGDHVVYDPFSDEDGWLLVGDRKTVIYESAKMTRELLTQ